MRLIDHIVLLIRHRQAAERSRDTLAKHGYDSVITSLSEINPLANPFPIGEFDAIILTSSIAPDILKNHAFFKDFSVLPVFCVGEFTAQCAIKAGFENIKQMTDDANALAAIINKQKSKRRFLYPCAQNYSFDFASNLDRKTFSCINWEIYSNHLISPNMAELMASLTMTNTVFLFSRRTARHFFQITKYLSEINADYACLAHHIFIAISQHTATAIPNRFKKNVRIAESKNEASMIQSLEAICRHN